MKKALFLFFSLFAPLFSIGQMYPVLIGTYTGPGKGKGVYSAMFDSQNGQLIPTLKYATVDNPSFLTLSVDGQHAYSVNESGNESAVSSYRFNELKSLIFLNKRVPMSSTDPCYIIASSKHVLTANYSSGDISVFPIEEDGGLSAVSQTIQHQGSSVNKQRQTKPHPHMILFTPDQKHILVSDLGTDKITMYAYNENSNQPLTFVKDFKMPEGSGPRHMTFSYDFSTLFVLGELDGNIYTFSFENNNIQLKNTVNTIHPERTVNDHRAADIHLSPDGQFLYASVRGDENLISVFEIGSQHNLKPIQNFKTGGMGPRNFAISPDGAWLLVAHQNSQDVTTYRRDETTGLLSETGNFINIASPVNLTFVY